MIVLVSVGHLLISVVMPVMRVGILRGPRRPSCGRRPVVASAESGSATSIPVISRPSDTALTAARASWSAVAAPAETPSSVAVGANRVGYLRVLAVDDRDDHGQPGIRRHLHLPPSVTSTRRCLGRFDDVGRRGAGGSQRGRDRRVLLRTDDEGGGDPLGGGKDRQLGTEGEGSEDRWKETGQ